MINRTKMKIGLLEMDAVNLPIGLGSDVCVKDSQSRSLAQFRVVSIV